MTSPTGVISAPRRTKWPRCSRSSAIRSLDALIDDTVPASIRVKAPLAWGPALTEREALDLMRETANRTSGSRR